MSQGKIYLLHNIPSQGARFPLQLQYMNIMVDHVFWCLEIVFYTSWAFVDRSKSDSEQTRKISLSSSFSSIPRKSQTGNFLFVSPLFYLLCLCVH